MIEWIYRKSQQHFITAMMFGTRSFGVVGGCLVLMYVIMTTDMPANVQHRFLELGYSLIAVAVSVTVPLAWYNTPQLRRALQMIHQGVPLSAELSRQATLEAIRFPIRQNICEAIVVPCTTAVPMCLDLWLRFTITGDLLLQICLATFLGVGLVLLITFFGSEQWMSVAIADLMRRGGAVDFDQLPRNHLKRRIMLCFSVIIMLTGVLVGALVHQEALDLTRGTTSSSSVQRIREHAILVTGVAIVLGCFYSHWLAQSITGRMGRLISIMQAVQAGDLTVRARSTGNDELDFLTRRFNDMISELNRQTTCARELNQTLEQKVDERTFELSQTLEQLQNLDRMKTEFFSNVSHELRTPLTMILSPIQQLQAHFAEQTDGRISSLLNVAHINSHRLLKQINQLLDFSKLQAGKAQINQSEVQLNAIAMRLVEAAGPLAEQRGIHLVAELAELMPVTCSDEDKLDVAITNLVTNAIKFTPYGGHIAIRTEALAHPEGTRLRFSVADTGPGIADQDLNKLFRRFVQLDGSLSREYSGTGLGLALVRELVELLGGSVGVTSQLGRGSTFWFEIPWRPTLVDSGVTEPSQSLTKELAFSDLKDCRLHSEHYESRPANPYAPMILIADDNAELRDMLVELLRDEYRIVTAKDGLDALSMLERITPDLFISDIMMPHMDGQAFCREVKRRPQTEAVPFILLTARSSTLMKIEGLDCGADDYVCKPFEGDELRARVRALLRLRRAHVQLDIRKSELEKANTELGHANESLKQAQQQLVQTEKLSSLGQLVAGLAHEINNSINAVYNGVPALKMRLLKLRNQVKAQASAEADGKLGEAFDKLDLLAGVIESGAERTARIVSDMKTFAHPGRERNEDFDFHRALDLCLNLSTKQTASPIQIKRNYGELPVVHGPYGQLHQVFLNILTNSVQAMGPGGAITVSTERVNHMFEVRLRDTGPGIPAANIRKIFEPFYTTKAPGVGTGLGLSISYSIVTKLGGSIECVSECDAEKEHGTEFILQIPVPRYLLNAESEVMASAR